MAAERLQHLEALASSDDRDTMVRHQAIARWLGFFMDAAGLRVELLAGLNQEVVDPFNTAAGYQRRDSGRQDNNT